MGFSDIIALDHAIIAYMSEIHTEFFNILMIWITSLGNSGLAWIAIAGVFLLFRKFREKGIILATGMIVNTLLGEVLLKHFFNRPRPFESMENIDLLIAAPITSSFPSGHTSTAFVFAFLFSWFFWNKHKYVVLFVWVMTLLIAYSRLYLQVHYPTDIFAGILLGYISYRMVKYGYSLYQKKINNIDTWN